MPVPKFAACDFGAASGRVILGTLQDQKMVLSETHRFSNPQVTVFSSIHWDLLHLFRELKLGLAKAASQGDKELAGIGVDTWGVDFGLIDANGNLLGHPHCYRDSRTEGIMDQAFKRLSREELYTVSGIQFLPFNTCFQLFSMVRQGHPQLQAAEHLLFMPDLFHYLLSGQVASEYTIASTSQLLKAKDRSWSKLITKKLEIPDSLLPSIVQPGTVIGELLPDICQETGLNPAQIIAPASHDTASAVAAVPAQGSNWAYLSSGTWSLLGVELDEPIITRQSLANNFTNEGGVEGRIRFLKNNMGLWLLERCRKSWRSNGQDFGYAELVELAKKASPFKTAIDPDDPSFLNPIDMPTAIHSFCEKTGQRPPQSEGEFARCIFESLAFKYRYIVDMINSMRTHPVERLHIVGGGSQNRLLNQFTSNALGIPVLAGPVEATAIGNVMIQAIASGEISDLSEGRALVADSFPLDRFEPVDAHIWEEKYQEATSLFR